MPKCFVLDTNVLLHNAESISAFADNTVVLPMAVIEELDKFKREHDELGRNARNVIRQLDSLRANGRLGDGVPMANGGTLRIMAGQGDFGKFDMNLNVADNKILLVAYGLHKQGEKVIFVSKDINARLKADALGIEVADFEKQKVNFDELFTGYREVKVTGKTIDDFYAKKTESMRMAGQELFPNEFVLLVDENDPKHSALARAMEKDLIAHLSTRHEKVWSIKPRNKEQRLAMELLMDPEVQIVTLVGQAGTGKTLLAIAAGLEATVHQKKYDKILVSRPIVPLGRDIGYLPGAKDEKLGHWMQPIFDNLSYLMRENNGEEPGGPAKDDVSKFKKDHLVELEALTYIRGRSIPRQYMIVDEAQNLTPHEIKTVVSRAGEGTKVILTGDPYQIDSPYLDSSSNGLTYAVERLKTQKIHGHMTLKKSERSNLAAIAADLL